MLFIEFRYQLVGAWMSILPGVLYRLLISYLPNYLSLSKNDPTTL
jgi:hypothetical protein